MDIVIYSSFSILLQEVYFLSFLAGSDIAQFAKPLGFAKKIKLTIWKDLYWSKDALSLTMQKRSLIFK